MKFIGLDAGSVSVKLCCWMITAKCKQLLSAHKGRPLPVALEMLKTVMRNGAFVTGDKNLYGQAHPLPTTNYVSLSLTGSAGRLIGTILGITPVNEVVAYAYATGGSILTSERS